jgi:co-chaperonin GroES (HSP10)
MSETIALPESELILPPGVKPIPENEVEAQSEQVKATQVPQPTGWKLLCVLIDVDNTYESGLLKADETMRTEELTSPVLFVMEVGPQAYKDAEKFPDGAWCKPGDFILTRPYTGTRVKIHGKEFRLINDDQVEAVVQDPRGISRA